MAWAAATAAVALALASTPAPARPADAAQRPLRYDLRPGDHLVYREWFERRTRSTRLETLTELEWRSHVLVLGQGDGFVRVGFQRDRARAELKRYDENGRDRLAEGRRELEQALARRGTSFAEANWLRADGTALLPWSAVREATSERLPLVHEIEPLPAEPVAAGGTFSVPGVLALRARVVGTEEVAGEPCLRMESAEPGYSLRRWHCEGTGTLGRMEYEARYGGPGGVEVSERLRLERVSLSRGGDPVAWLGDPATARGTLAALEVSDRGAVPPAAIHALFAGAPDAQRQALAVAWRQRLPPPPLDALRPLAAAAGPRVRALAARLLGLRPEAEARALRETLARDADPFVRGAAADRPAVPEPLLRLALEIRGSGPLPAWTGPLEPGIGRRLLAAQRSPGQVPGATLRFMADPRFRGRPYVLHVPDDYRGDEPFPLVVVLGGGPGRAIPTAQGAFSELDARGTLAVFPQANGMWWDDEPASAVAALLRELLSDLNVDTDRVTITGFSNGGTGTVLYASRAPDLYAAYASLMGAGLPFFQERPLETAALARLPALFVHGDRDETIPAWASEDTVRALRRANPAGTVELHLLPKRGHDIVIGRDEGLTLPFLERFAREAFPRRIVLRAARLDDARSFWAEVLDKRSGTAEIDGEIAGQEITLRTRGVRRLRLRLRRELVDLGAPVRVTLDGREAHTGPLAEDAALFLRSWRETRDPQLAHAAELVLDVK